VYGTVAPSPRYWQNPENFDTERFTKANEKRSHAFTFLPSGRTEAVSVKLRDAADPH